MRVVLEPTELAEVLSPSQVRCFMDCQVRWWFKYGLRYPDPSTGNLALGRAVHAALAQNFEQKMQSYEDLPILGVIALFRQAWAAEREETEFRDDEDPLELARCGEGLVRKYLEEVAPTIAPAAVEAHVTGEIAGVPVQGWIDVLDIRGRIIEIKTAARKPSAISPEHRFQIATYAQLMPQANFDARIDTLVKTKTPGLVTQRFTITDQDIMATTELYPMAQMAMRSELYMPNRTSMNCSRRSCSFWRRCEQEFGGEVPA
jgi:CRISPR/Cas system-associated exonuclease Cas4 (RecB family)